MIIEDNAMAKAKKNAVVIFDRLKLRTGKDNREMRSWGNHLEQSYKLFLHVKELIH